MNDITIIKPISAPGNTNIDVAGANAPKKIMKSVNSAFNPNLMNQNKDQYTVFLEKKLKTLEALLDLPPGCNQYNNKLAQYRRISHLLSDNASASDYTRPQNTNMVILPLPSPANKQLENSNVGGNIGSVTTDVSTNTNNVNNNNAICQSASLLNDPRCV